MELTSWITVAGVLVGLIYGVFGVGSAFATPLLSIIGVPGMSAVVGPLPALLPGSAAGAWSYSREGHVDWLVARRTIIGALPAALLGALTSTVVGGPPLLILSGVVLFVVGIRVLRSRTAQSTDEAARARAEARRTDARFVTGMAAVVGFSAGLLANGGGFLLVPMFLLLLGLDVNQAAGTSMMVAAALTVPTVTTHVLAGDVNWGISMLFAAGLVPGAMAGGMLAQRLPTHRLRMALGVLLVGFASWYLLRQALGLFG